MGKKAKAARRAAAPEESRSTALVAVPQPKRTLARADTDMMAALLAAQDQKPEVSPWQVAVPAPGVVPEGAAQMAQDDALTSLYAFAQSGFYGEGLRWLGYPYLAELAQRPEYRRISETIAREMTRKWIKLTAVGDADKTKEIALLDAAFKKYHVQDLFRRASELDGFFGRAQIYIDTGASDDPDELKTILRRNKAKIGKGRLRGLRVIEPIWSYPTGYNADDPLREDYYRPRSWYIRGREVHTSRLLTFVSREVPDLLKPAYAFGGLSMSQMAQPYVENWLRTRQSVSDLLHSFSVSVLSTNMAATFAENGTTGLINRAKMFNMLRDNRSLMMLDKEQEEFANVSAPLGTLDHLQAQSQEQMASVAGIPLVVLLGITPSGLNASSDGEVRTFFSYIESQQEQFYTSHLNRVLEIIQLSVLGDVDPGITFKFNPLWQLDEEKSAAVRKQNADTAVEYINAGVLSPLEERTRIAADEDSLYPSLDVNDLPEPPGDPGMGDPGMGGDPDAPPDDVDPDDGSPPGRQPPPGRQAPGREPPPGRQPPGRQPPGRQAVGRQPPAGRDAPGRSNVVPFRGAHDDAGYEHWWHGTEHSGGPIEVTVRLLPPVMGGGGGLPDADPDLDPGIDPVLGGDPDAAPAEDAAEFNEADHPRDDDGKFGSGGGGGSTKAETFGAKGSKPPAELNGIKFASWTAPTDAAGWHSEAEKSPSFDEPAMPKPTKFTASNGKEYTRRQAAGVIIKEPDGRVWVMHPTDGYGGYKGTFPKGGIEDDLSPQATAIKEAYEETGLRVKLTGFAGDVERDTSQARYYFAERTGGTPEDHGPEAEAVTLSPVPQLYQHLNRTVDRKMAETILGMQPKPGSKPAAKPAGAAASPASKPAAAAPDLKLADMKQVGGKLGSNPGGRYKDASGKDYYVKLSKSPDHAKNEVLASKLYQAAGAPVLDAIPVDTGNGKMGTATEWQKQTPIDRHDAAQRKEAQQHFATHAWLANWDAAGLDYDNQGRVNGKMTTLDPGGSLIFRAQGGPKGDAFGNSVGEWDTLRSKSNAQAHAIFGEMTPAQLKASAEKVAKVTNKQIRDLVEQHGPGTPQQRGTLADKLIARRDDIAKRAGIAQDKGFNESDHPRGQPGNAGEFGPGSGGGKSASSGAHKMVRRGFGAAHSAAKRFAAEDYHILREHLHQPGSAPRKNLGQHISSVARALPKLLQGHLREEKHNAIHTVGALRSLAGGNKPSPEQMRGLRAFATRLLLTSASVAVGDPTGSIGHLAGALGHEVVQHVIIEHALKAFAGMGMLAVKGKGRPDAMDAGDEISAPDMALLQRFAEALAAAARDLDDHQARALLDESNPEAEDEFKEADHPRGQPGNAGEFGPGGGGTEVKPKAPTGSPQYNPATTRRANGEKPGEGASHTEAKSASLSPTKLVGGKRVQANGSPLPPHIASLAIPPAWANVRFNPDKNGNVLVSGRDAKNRPVQIQSKEYAASQAAKKYARVKALAKVYGQIEARNDAARRDPRTRDVADCLALVMATGIRPGSERDTGAEAQGYGATTLRGSHVVSTQQGVKLRFVPGKKHGQTIEMPIDNPSVAKMLLKRKEAAGAKGKLFGAVTNNSLLAHTKSMAGNTFKTKDLRTHVGTQTAMRLVNSMPPPADAKAYKRAVLQVADAVANKLGNTRTIALQSYIAPEVFSGWKMAA